MKYSSSTNNFSAGEWSEQMLARTDVDQYPRACKELTNFIPQLTGGAAYRKGSIVVDMHSSQEAKLQAYATWKLITLHHTSGYQINIGISSGYIGTWICTDSAGATFPIAAGPTGSDYLCDPRLIQWVQIGNIIVMTDGGTYNGRPRVIYYDAGIVWVTTLEGYASIAGVLPFETMSYGDLQANSVNVSLTPSATTGTITLTASAPYFLSSSVIGTRYKFYNGSGALGVGLVTGWTSSTVVTVQVEAVLPGVVAYGTAAGSAWQESEWSPYKGWPLTVAAYQERLIFGGSKTYPLSVWGSAIGNLFDFDEVPSAALPSFATYTDDNSRPFTMIPIAGSGSRITTLSSGKTLCIFTDANELVAYGVNGAFGPNDVTIETSSSFGAEPIGSVRVNSFVAYAQNGGKKIRHLQFDGDDDNYKSRDVGFTASHMFTSDPIYELSMSNTNTSLLWAKTGTGNLYACSMDEEYSMSAWSRVTLGGPSTANIKTVDVVRVAGGTVYLMMIVTRGSLTTLEKIECSTFTTDTDLYNIAAWAAYGNVFLDKVGFISGAPATVFSGFTKWNNETVSVIADGFYIGEKTLVGDTLTLASSASVVVIGYKYPGYILPVPVEAGQQVGSSQGTIKRTSEMFIRFFRSYGLKYGRSKTDLIDVPSINPNVLPNVPPVMETGSVKVDFPAGYDRVHQVVVAHDSPWPCHVLSITVKGAGYD